MLIRLWGLLAGLGLLLFAGSVKASPETPQPVLLVYGPGGPYHVIQECADRFEAQAGIDVYVQRVLPGKIDARFREIGDIYYGGAEYMLEEFDRRNPGVLDVTTLEKLSPRRIGIIVRKGNPLEIKGVSDLLHEDVDLLDVKLENMRHFHTTPDGRSARIRRSEYTGQRGASAWLDDPEIDAWITYKSWHAALEEHADFIELFADQALRYTPIAVTHNTPRRQEALAFIRFLKSKEAQRIFAEHGWD